MSGGSSSGIRIGNEATSSTSLKDGLAEPDKQPSSAVRAESSSLNSRNELPETAEEEVLDVFRRRAVSEVRGFRPHTASHSTSRWHIVAAWSSLRKSWGDARRLSEIQSSHDGHSDNNNVNPHINTKVRVPPNDRDNIGVSSGDEDSQKLLRASAPPAPPRPRKRVSLFLRRRAHAHARKDDDAKGDDGRRDVVQERRNEEATTARESIVVPEEQRRRFRRAQSHLVKPVSLAALGGEGGRYLEYAADVDEDSFERLKEVTRNALRKYASKRPSAIRVGKSDAEGKEGGIEGEREEIEKEKGEDLESERKSGDGETGIDDEIIGEICLEDFADGDSADFDFDFVDGQVVDVWEEEDNGRPSLRLDKQQLRWIGNEQEFAAFFAEVGLQDFFEVQAPSEKDLLTFKVDDDVLEQWLDDANAHNIANAKWKGPHSNADIRTLVEEFVQRRRRQHDMKHVGNG